MKEVRNAMQGSFMPELEDPIPGDWMDEADMARIHFEPTHPPKSTDEQCED